jgi:hypothetical protein
MLYYRARGYFRRLLLNGEVIIEQKAAPGVWWPTQGPLRAMSLRLRNGDVLAFDLAGEDDDCALHAVGVDRDTGRVVLASHPLIFDASATTPEQGWYRDYEGTPGERPNLSRAQDESVMRQLRDVLGREFPGLPIGGPAIGPEREVHLRTTIR